MADTWTVNTHCPNPICNLNPFPDPACCTVCTAYSIVYNRHLERFYNYLGKD